jgi:hypothetical protein
VVKFILFVFLFPILSWAQICQFAPCEEVAQVNFSDRGLALVSAIGLQSSAHNLNQSILNNGHLQTIRYQTPCTKEQIAAKESWARAWKDCPGFPKQNANGSFGMSERPQPTNIQLARGRIEDIDLKLAKPPVCKDGICKLTVNVNRLKVSGDYSIANEKLLLSPQPVVLNLNSQSLEPVTYEFEVEVDKNSANQPFKVKEGSSRVNIPPGSLRLTHRNLADPSRLDEDLSPEVMRRLDQQFRDLVNGNPVALANDLKTKEQEWRQQGRQNEIAELRRDYLRKRDEALRSYNENKNKPALDRIVGIQEQIQYWSQNPSYNNQIANHVTKSLQAQTGMNDSQFALFGFSQIASDQVLNQQILAPVLGQYIAKEFDDVEKEIATGLRQVPEAVQGIMNVPSVDLNLRRRLAVVESELQNKSKLTSTKINELEEERKKLNSAIDERWNQISGQIVMSQVSEANKGLSFGLLGHGADCPRPPAMGEAEADMDVDLPISSINKYLESMRQAGALDFCTEIEPGGECKSGKLIKMTEPLQLEVRNGKIYYKSKGVDVGNHKNSLDLQGEVVPKVCGGALCLDGVNPDTKTRGWLIFSPAKRLTDQALNGALFGQSGLSIPRTDLQKVQVNSGTGKIRLSYNLLP